MPVIEELLVTAVMETSVNSAFSCWALPHAPCAVQQAMAVSESLHGVGLLEPEGVQPCEHDRASSAQHRSVRRFQGMGSQRDACGRARAASAHTEQAGLSAVMQCSLQGSPLTPLPDLRAGSAAAAS